MEGVVPLEQAYDESVFGSKAVGLGEASLCCGSGIIKFAVSSTVS